MIKVVREIISWWLPLSSHKRCWELARGLRQGGGRLGPLKCSATDGTSQEVYSLGSDEGGKDSTLLSQEPLKC